MPDINDISEIYDNLASDIAKSSGQCVLLLGPELSVDQNGNYYKSYFKQFVERNKGVISEYFPSENLFGYDTNNFTTFRLITKSVTDFYNHVGDNVLLDMIARVPFPLVFNVCPDVSLNNLYIEKKIRFQPGYFFNKDTSSDSSILYPTRENPVLFNIFGTVDLEQSLILTHSDLYESIRKFISEGSLPPTIERFLQVAKSFIFLGFKFDSWYYQLVCHKLGIGGKKTSLSVPQCEENPSMVHIVMKEYFKMKFTSENPARTIGRIVETCEKLNPSPLRDLIKPSDHAQVFISYARNNEFTDITDIINDALHNKSVPVDIKSKFIYDVLIKAGWKVPSEEKLKEQILQCDKENYRSFFEWLNTLSQQKANGDPDSLKNQFYWQSNREGIVELIRKKLEMKEGLKIQVIVDKNELTYGDSIDSFMNRIGNGKTIILVISDKYLKSRYCMDEALRIARYDNKDKRVFIIILNDVHLEDANKIEYKQYWEGIVEGIYGRIDNSIKNLIDKERVKKNYSIYLDILDFIDLFIEKIKDEIYLPTNYYFADQVPAENSAAMTTLDEFLETIENKMKNV